MSRTPAPPGNSSSSPADTERDAWLSEALRHAPDADVAPPSALSEMILRAAQAKARPAAPPVGPSLLPFWSRLWVWMAQPSVGAGLASVMVAGLVGVMMWDRPLEDHSPRSSPMVAAAPENPPAPAAAVAPESKIAAAPPPAKTSSPPPAAHAKQEAPAATDSSVAANARRRQAATPSADLQRQAMESHVEQIKEAPSADKLARPDALAKAARTAEAMSPAAPAVNVPPFPASTQPSATLPVPPSMPAPIAPAAPPKQTTTSSGFAAPSGAATPAPRREADHDTAGTAAASSDVAKPLAKGLLAESTERSFDTLRAALASEPAQWTWQRNGGPVHSIDDALSSFLAEADAVTTGRWQPPRAVPFAPQASSEANSGPSNTTGASARSAAKVETVRLMRDGRPVHTLRLGARALHWDREFPNRPAFATGSAASLDDAQSQRLRAALDKLGP